MHARNLITSTRKRNILNLEAEIMDCKHKLKAVGKMREYKDKEDIYCYKCKKKDQNCWVKCHCGNKAMMYSRKSDLFICMECNVKGI